MLDELYNIKVITELKAIHNGAVVRRSEQLVVQHQSYYRIESNSQLKSVRQDLDYSCTTSKLLQNWKQFTTIVVALLPARTLYNIKVITELKAIHNYRSSFKFRKYVVQHQSYYRIESNSQPPVMHRCDMSSCTTSKLLQNWKQFTTFTSALPQTQLLYNIKVITELKAIHNLTYIH